MTFPAWYGILVGVLMIAQWTFTIFAGAVPEFETAPWEIAFHLAAEFTTALLLLGGGIASLRSVSRGKPVLLTGLGMVIYSEIVSPGYYAQLGQFNGRSSRCSPPCFLARCGVSWCCYEIQIPVKRTRRTAC